MNEETVRAGRDRYLAENSLSVESYTARRFPIYVGRRPVQVPNPGFLPWHDLHHVATGYRTGLIGEAEISAYELRAGCGSLMVFILCVGAILITMFVAPRRIWRAWRQAKGARTLYHTKVPYETLLEMKVADLRDSLGLPREGCRQA
jgi:hypothetical protein